jgi:hypothetical protein
MLAHDATLSPHHEPTASRQSYDPPLDPRIAAEVEALRDGGVETFESCEGGIGHSYAEPTVRFHGDQAEGYRALAVALRAGLRVTDLRRVWPILAGEPTGPWWEMVFIPTMDQID